MTFPHPSPAKTPSHKLLLSSVFGPFAIDDLYGRKENRIVGRKPEIASPAT
jgi:hypothetical protein